MKKIIAAMLSALVGLFGYTIVDTAIETRVSTLESRVAELEAYHGIDDDITRPTTKPVTPNPTDELKKIVEDIYANTTAIDFEVDRARDIDISYPEEVKEFFGIESSGEIYSAVYSDSEDYELLRFMCIAKIKNPASVENLKAEMLEGLDCAINSRKISEKALVASCNDIILVVMASEEIADDIYNAFDIVNGNAASEPLSKYGINGNGKCGDYASWNLTPDGTLTISGRGCMYDSEPEWRKFRYYIKDVIIGEEITSIGYWVFAECENLTGIVIPNCVTEIGNNAFYNCTSLTDIVIPDSVTYIGGGAFENCTSLTSIMIPDGVTEIGSSAFYNCTSLTHITIPNGVEWIGSSAFEGCSNLKTLSLSKNVYYIYNMAFAKCDNLTDVYYAGTEEEWNAIEIKASNARLTDATIHYNCTV